MMRRVNPSFNLTAGQIGQFRREGFITLDRITSDAEVERLRAIFDRLFSTGAGRDKGSQFDLAGTDEEGRPPVLPQIVNPVEFAPELAETEFRAAALDIARQLLGPEAQPWFEHAILKPAGYGAPTPWHQDEAHRSDPGVDYEQVSIWMPLQEATVENGCMEFIPRTHLGQVLDHRSPGNDPRVMALECVGAFDPATAVPCPLRPGGATVHHWRTLHHAGANTSSNPRRAYILAFRGKFTPNPQFKGYDWNTEKSTAAQVRRAAWENRGGLVGRASRSTGAFVSRMRQKAARILRP
jgi:ectoine hydroxylase-related dioxygenase (phytanoyl-CoA dioxygenase family)